MRWVGQLTIDELHPFNVKEFWCSNPEKQTLIDETLLLVSRYTLTIATLKTPGIEILLGLNSLRF